jgi:hypothetical protein
MNAHTKAMRAWMLSDAGKRGMAAQAGALCALWTEAGAFPEALIGNGAGSLVLFFFLAALVRAYDIYPDGFHALHTNQNTSHVSADHSREPLQWAALRARLFPSTGTVFPPVSPAGPSVWWLGAHSLPSGKRVHLHLFLESIERFVTGNDASYDMFLARSRRPYRWYVQSWMTEIQDWWRMHMHFLHGIPLIRFASSTPQEPVLFCSVGDGHSDGFPRVFLHAYTARAGHHITWTSRLTDDANDVSMRTYASFVPYTSFNAWFGITLHESSTTFSTTCERVWGLVIAVWAWCSAALRWWFHTEMTGGTSSNGLSIDAYGSEVALECVLRSREAHHVGWVLLDAITWNKTIPSTIHAPDFSPQHPQFDLLHWHIHDDDASWYTDLQTRMACICAGDAGPLSLGSPALSTDTFRICVNWGMIRTWHLAGIRDTSAYILPYDHESFVSACASSSSPETVL